MRICSNGFRNIQEQKRYLPLRTLGFLACAYSGCLRPVDLKNSQEVDWSSYYCSYCDSDDIPSADMRKSASTSSMSELFATLENIIKLDEFQESQSARTWGVLSLKRLLNHTMDLDHLNLSTSPLGQWCIETLNSSWRPLRYATT